MTVWDGYSDEIAGILGRMCDELVPLVYDQDYEALVEHIERMHADSHEIRKMVNAMVRVLNRQENGTELSSEERTNEEEAEE